MHRQPNLYFVVAALAGFVTCVTAAGPDRITVQRDGQEVEMDGRILVTGQDGSLLFEQRDGTYTALAKDQLVQQMHEDVPFTYFSHQELAEQLLREFQTGFDVHHTAHYVICYNTTRAYAQWCGALFERLHHAYYSFWRRRGIDLEESPPLVALVFENQPSFSKYARDELHNAVNSVIGYYSLTTNRMTTYDLTGLEQQLPRGVRIRSAAHVNQLLSRPGSARTVATIVHEATHQLAFNSGLFVRMADNPLWLNEGLAIYFETPDLNHSKGWRTVGQVNYLRLGNLAPRLASYGDRELVSLIASDDRFRQPDLAEAAYAESWGLCYFLLRTRPDEFTEYVQRVREKKPLLRDTPEQRLLDFTATFGEDTKDLCGQMVRYLSRLQ